MSPGGWPWALILLFAGCTGNAPDDQVVARVGETVILREDLQRAYQLPTRAADTSSVRAWEDAARDWAIREILLQEAAKRQLEQDSLFRARIADLRDELLIQRLYEKAAQPGEIDSAEVLDEYNRSLGEFVTPADQVDLAYLQAPAREAADAARRALQAGEDLSAVLNQNEALRGQILGWVNYGDLSPDIAKAAFSLLPGAISYPLKYEKGGYLVLHCRQRRVQGTILPLEEVFDQIRDRIKLRQQADAEWTFRDSLWKAYQPEIKIK